MATNPDPDGLIAEARADIERLQAQREGLGLDVLRRREGAGREWAQTDGKLEARERDLRIAEDARLSLEREQPAKAEAAAVADRARLEAARAEAETALSGRLRTVEEAARLLADAVEEAISAANGHYNAGVALGLHGNPVAVRDRISQRIAHVLRLSGLPDYDLGIGPSARSPLDGDAAPSPVPAPRGPLPDRRDERDERGRIVSTKLLDADGNWVEVAPGATELPARAEAAS